MSRILITGSEGLVGRALAADLRAKGLAVASLDLKASPGSAARGDIADRDRVESLVEGCAGVVHLAAVSRVLWGERDPERCWLTNVGGTRNVLDAVARSRSRPWVLFASSREVYGEPGRLPVDENAPLSPVNVYGRSKVEGERMMLEARDHGLATTVVRFSNVYGRTDDHPDRVIPAFARGAAEGTELRVDGSQATFDFTHVEDTVAGVVAVVDAIEHGEVRLPPIHFCAGRATTLGELAIIANRAGGQRSRIVEAPPRTFDVARFVGDPRRAQELLGWRAEISLERGVRRLVSDFESAAQDRPTPADPGTVAPAARATA